MVYRVQTAVNNETFLAQIQLRDEKLFAYAERQLLATANKDTINQINSLVTEEYFTVTSITSTQPNNTVKGNTTIQDRNETVMDAVINDESKGTNGLAVITEEDRDMLDINSGELDWLYSADENRKKELISETIHSTSSRSSISNK